ncbi:guanylate cyclase 32E [Elysia marginata]|uniref:Guanylate cyclase 32E n=1 Tax=Elysia marginata TaxID=1093978 RepID=A0AAV4IL01_9GAST|nr:guanylate cyclase 32E [Elysia marginata]
MQSQNRKSLRTSSDESDSTQGIPTEWTSSHYDVNRENGTNSPTSSDILEWLEPSHKSCLLRVGKCWRGDPLSDTGKRQQILQILSLTLLPILGLWAFTVYSVSDSIKGKTDLEQTQNAVKFSVELGLFLDRIQRERDMSVLYLSILGPETKTFLMNEYLLTDEALLMLSEWPVNDDFGEAFRSKFEFQEHLNAHRNELDPNNFDIYVEMNFYNLLIERFVVWMYGAITESSMASIWKVLVAYQKIVTGKFRDCISLRATSIQKRQRASVIIEEKVGQNKKIDGSAVLYSDIVDPIFQEGVTSDGTNLTVVIERFRFEIQHSILVEASISKGQWWFDNMTIYLDRLLIIQQDLAELINGELQSIIDVEEKNLTISVCFLALVIFMCPLVICSVEALTTGIQLYAIAMVQKSKELVKEKQKADALLYRMVPGPIVAKLKRCKSVEAEYFKSVTIMFCDINDFNSLIQTSQPSNAISLLNTVFNTIDTVIVDYDVFKVENIFDSYMVASGLLNKGSLHASVVANLALELLSIFQNRNYITSDGTSVQIRIGVHTGPCVAGTITITPPQYCLFGHSVSIAARMKACCPPNSILVSHSSQRILKRANYLIKYMSTVDIKLDERQPDTYIKAFRLVGKIGSGHKKEEPSYGLPESRSTSLSLRRQEEPGQHSSDRPFFLTCDATSFPHDTSGPPGNSRDVGIAAKDDEASSKAKEEPDPKDSNEEAQSSEKDETPNKPSETVQRTPEAVSHTYDL